MPKIEKKNPVLKSQSAFFPQNAKPNGHYNPVP